MSAGNTQLSPVRRPTQQGYHRHKDELTVPLRPCCEACEHITDQSLKEGEHWKEKFSRGARRRRSASLENNDLRGESHFLPTRIRNEFLALSRSLDVMEPSRYGSPSTFSLTVDEVDKRRKSMDLSGSSISSTVNFASSSSSPAHVHSPGSPYSGRYPRHRPHERDVSSSSVSSTSTTDEIVPEGFDPRDRLRSSPIEEEDEGQLFPLPSPRRSPSGTPSPSPSPKISPAPSPNGSTSWLAELITTGTTSAGKSSKENHSPSKTSSSQESLLKASLSRKQNGGYLAAPALSTPKSTSPVQSSNGGRLPSNSSTLATSPIAAAASASPASPTTTGVSSVRRIRIPTAPKSGEKAASGSISPKGPRPPNFIRDAPLQEGGPQELFPFSTSSPPRVPPKDSPPASQTATSPSTGKPLLPLRLTTVSIKPVVGFPTSAATSIPPSPKSPIYTRHAQSSPSTQTGHQHSASQSSATSTSPESPISPIGGAQKRKRSFTLPFIKAGEAIRDAGADVLRGVGSMSGAGVVGTI
jgi:hypothetical protein